MVERSLSMREAAGSMPASSIFWNRFWICFHFLPFGVDMSALCGRGPESERILSPSSRENEYLNLLFSTPRPAVSVPPPRPPFSL